MIRRWIRSNRKAQQPPQPSLSTDGMVLMSHTFLGQVWVNEDLASKLAVPTSTPHSKREDES